ncbi:unnamed protein product [Symbiodinium sp. CCMP2592]|nr:unnamed protein product [Symbiodinium sp. CCMP2592]
MWVSHALHCNLVAFLAQESASIDLYRLKMAADGVRRQAAEGRFILDLSRFGSPIRLDVTAFAEKVRSDKWLLLAACLLIDFIGMASYMVLLLGEVTDIMWAPFAGFLLQYLFGSWLVSSLGALEEFLPFTDILPTATLAWAICYLECLRFLRVLLGVQRHSSHGELASDHSHDD